MKEWEPSAMVPKMYNDYETIITLPDFKEYSECLG